MNCPSTNGASILRRAEVWQPIATDRLDLLSGPHVPGRFALDANVTCAFHFPDKPLTGVIAEVRLRGHPGRRRQGEIRRGQRGSVRRGCSRRLFWALGFPADREYPVKVTCRNCPADPFAERKTEWRLGRPGRRRTRRYDPATIEREFRRKKVEVPGFEGWSWPELDLVAAKTRRPARTCRCAEAAGGVHSARRQQAAEPGHHLRRGRHRAPMAKATRPCRAPFLVVKDLGRRLPARRSSVPENETRSWRVVPIWSDPTTCQADLTRSIVGTLRTSRVSEAGREFPGRAARPLSDAQVRDLFTAARVERR